MEFGSSMEIKCDGSISWYFGADGGNGILPYDICHLNNDFVHFSSKEEKVIVEVDKDA